MKAEIYTVDYCPYCKAAKKFFSEHNIEYTEHDITEDETIMRKKLGEMFDIKGEVTVPQIILNGQYIGGYSDMIYAYNEGKLSL